MEQTIKPDLLVDDVIEVYGTISNIWTEVKLIKFILLKM